MAQIKLVTFTTLYPNVSQPCHGLFVEHRLRYLLKSREVETRVVAPVPWFPFKHSCFGRYAVFARVPYKERRHDIDILHPRYPVFPKIGMTLAPFLLAGAMRPVFANLIKNGYRFDLIDAHYFYPDGVAAVILGRIFRKPVIVTGRGTDINWIPKYRMPRRLIVHAALRADAVITVCEALKGALIALGVPGNKITSLRNGVDLDLFRPDDRQMWRARLGVSGTTLVYVGHLIKRKGHDLVIRAVAELDNVNLLIVGEGKENAFLKSLVQKLGITDRVTFLGAVPQETLRSIYSAADALVLASSREGWPNVLLEAMACGTPVIASPVWGTPEVVTAPEAGVLMRERTPAGLVQAFHALFANYPSRKATRRYAERFDWEETTQLNLTLIRDILAPRLV
jgi:glycosyltransferase involved in cell wall biosynthesis